MNTQNWKSDMTTEDRIKVFHHILTKLNEVYAPGTDRENLRNRTRIFESQAFQRATSRQDYLEQIAEGLSQLEQSHQARNPQLSRSQQQPPPQRPPAMPQQPAAVAAAQAQSVEAQAALRREQIRQHNVFLQRQEMQGRILGQQGQQQQQGPRQTAPQQQAAVQTKAQDPTRKAAIAAKRSPTVPDGKPNESSAKAATTAPATAATAKSQPPNPTSVAELEAQHLMLQRNMKHSDFAALATLPLAARNEYLKALTRQSNRIPMTSQSVSSAALQAAHQPSTTQQLGQPRQFVPPGVMGDMNAAQQQTQQPVNASLPVQVPNRGSQGAHPAVNMQMHRKATMDPSSVNDQRAAQLATIAAAASNLGINVSPEQIRNFNQDQLRQFFALWTSRNASMNAANQNAAAAAATQRQQPPNLGRVNDGQAHANINPGAMDHGNIANWMGRMGNAGVANQAKMMAQNNMNRALALNKQALLQKAGEQQLQQTNAAAQSNAAFAAQAKRAVGMSPSQMNSLLTNQKAKHDKAGVTPQESQPTMAEALQNPNRVSNSRGLVGASVGMVHGNAAMAMMNSAPLQQQPSEALQSAQKPPVPGAAAAAAQEEQFWKRLEDIRRKYSGNLNRLLPFIQELHQKQPIPQQAQFITILRECITVLRWRRGVTNLSKIGLSMSILDKTEGFLSKLLSPNSAYVANQISGNRSQPGRDGSEANATINPGAKGLAQPNAQAAMGNAGARSIADPTTSHVVPRIDPAQLTPQQKLRLRQQHVYHVQQHQQSLQLLKEMNAAQRHSVQQRTRRPATGMTAGLDVSKHAAAVAAAATPGAQYKNAKVRPQATKAGARSQAPPQVSRQAQGVTMNPMHVHGRGQTQTDLQVKTQAQVAQVGVRVPNPAAVQQHTQAQAQALAQAKANKQRVHQIQAQQAAAKAHQSRRAATSGTRATQSMTRTHLSGTQSGLKQSESWGAHSQTTAATSVTGAPPQVPQAVQPRERRPEMSAPQKLQQIENMVKEVSQQAHQIEQAYEMEAKRQKSERIQITLAALRNSSSASASDEAEKRGVKRKNSLADVENHEAADGVIETKTVFECSPETGLRLAKRPRNEAGDMQLMRDAVKMDVEAAKERNSSLSVEIIEEFGLPVVKCMLKIPGIRFPKLVLRVQRGYPRKGGATYGFERPPMGWVGVLEQVRSRFKQVLSISPAASVGVAAILDAWASEADAVVNGSEVSDEKKVKEGEKV